MVVVVVVVMVYVGDLYRHRHAICALDCVHDADDYDYGVTVALGVLARFEKLKG
jgi:hypothetical protein